MVADQIRQPGTQRQAPMNPMVAPQAQVGKRRDELSRDRTYDSGLSGAPQHSAHSSPHRYQSSKVWEVVALTTNRVRYN